MSAKSQSNKHTETEATFLPATDPSITNVLANMASTQNLTLPIVAAPHDAPLPPAYRFTKARWKGLEESDYFHEFLHQQGIVLKKTSQYLGRFRNQAEADEMLNQINAALKRQGDTGPPVKMISVKLVDFRPEESRLEDRWSLGSAGHQETGMGGDGGSENAGVILCLGGQFGDQRDRAVSSMGIGLNPEAKEWYPSGGKGGKGAARL